MKKNNFNLTLLTSVFILGLILANLFGGKLIDIFGFTVTGAIIIYPLTFLTTDIISEIWGRKEANDCVKIGFIIQIAFILIGYIALAIPSLETTVYLQESLKTVLNQGTRMSIASLTAFMCSQFLDILIFHKLKEKCNGKHKWLRNNASTMTSQFIDTVIFIIVAFYGVVDNIILMVVCQYAVKLALALLDTPFFYFFTRKNKADRAKLN